MSRSLAARPETRASEELQELGASASGEDDDDGGSSSSSDGHGRCFGCGCGSWEAEPAHVPEDAPFCHKDCLLRGCGLVGLMLAVAFLGSALLQQSQVLGTAVLTVGPALAIVSCFYSRYRFSTTARQIWVTFFEAIMWMVPLLFLITFIDVWNNNVFLRQMQASCTWGAQAGGEHLLWRISWAAHCAEAAAAPEGLSFTSWGGKLCPEDPAMAQAIVGSNATISKAGLIAFANGTVAEGEDQPLGCPALDKVLSDVPAEVGIRLQEVSWDDPSTPTDDAPVVTWNRTALADVHERLFGRVPELYIGGNVTMVFQARVQTLAHTMVTAFFRAGFLEELLKYIAVRRVLFKDRVVDCGGITVYGLAAGAGFATAENIQYALSYGADVTYARMVLSIPLHCCCGLIIGIFLGYRKFLGWKCYCMAALAAPVLIHGTYDFVLMLPASYGLDQGVRLVIVTLILLASFAYTRMAWLVLDAVCVVDVRKMMSEGRVSHPGCCCQECDCCCAWFSHSDTVLKRYQDSSSRTSSVPSGGAGSEPERSRSLARQVTEVLLPREPRCQTVPMTCPGCSAPVRAHVLYPSLCPHCATPMPEEVRLPAAV